MSTINDLVK